MTLSIYIQYISSVKGHLVTYPRASRSQSRLVKWFALLSIEKETLKFIDFTNIIDEFATMKARRVHL